MSSLNRIFGWLADIWIIPSDPIPDYVETIVSTSQGMSNNKLVKQNQQHMDKVLEISNQHPEALIGYSAFAGSLDPKAELAIKKAMLLGKKSVSAGSVSNTASEAMAYHQKLVESLGHEPKVVVLVTSQFHGRAVRFVYKKEFPNFRIVLVFTPWKGEVNPQDLHLLSRNKWLWLGANLARQVMIVIPFGYWLFKKLDVQQPNVH